MKRLFISSTAMVLSVIVAHAVVLKPWLEILGPPEGKVPEANNFTVKWRDNLTAAFAEARLQNRPLFVTFRCLPCKQCSAFDKEVLEGGDDLNPLLNQFITVRLTDAAAIDRRIFPIEGFADLDMSWWGWFLSPEGRVYGIFGGRDEISDATRISKPALMATMQRILAHHYDPRRPGWDIDGPAPDLSGDAKSPRQLPGYQGWMRGAHEESRQQACLHCHQVNDILRQPAVAAGTFDKERDFDVWPLPENVGLTVDRDHGLLVTSVAPGSAADKAGIKPHDILGAAGGRRCFSQADFRGVLHRGPRGPGEIEIWWTRDSQVLSGKLAVPENWRKTVLDWRMSVSQGIVGAYPGFFPLAINEKRREKFKIPAGQMAIEPYMGDDPKNPPYAAGIRKSQILTAVNGQSPNLTGRAFLVWFIKHYEPGDHITATIIDGTGEQREISYTLPKRAE
jgi:serine protease Do